jgi:hypothetical protein
MTVTLEPGLEHEVRQKAAAQGQGADEYVNRLIKTALHQSAPTIIRSTLTPKERRRFQQERVARAAARDMPASTSDFRREDIYDDEEGR